MGFSNWVTFGLTVPVRATMTHEYYNISNQNMDFKNCINDDMQFNNYIPREMRAEMPQKSKNLGKLPSKSPEGEGLLLGRLPHNNLQLKHGRST